MFKKSLLSASQRLATVTLLAATAFYGCGGGTASYDNSSVNPAELSIKNLKDRFYSEHKCDVYEKINTYVCAGDIMQATCKDAMGALQQDFYTRDAMNPNVWLSQKDIDAEIADLNAKLADAMKRKGVFAAVQNPATAMCTQR
jgi:hypothetical protein